MDFNSPPRPSKVLPGVGRSVLMPWFRILVLPQSAIDVQAQLSNHCSVSTPCEESRRLLLDLLICVVLHRSGHLFRVKAGTFFDCSIGHSSNPCSKLCGPLPATTPDSTQTTAWRFHRNAKRENYPRSVTASEARDASEVVAARIVTSTGDLHPSLVPLGHICFFSFCNDAMVSPVWAGVNPGCRSCCDRSAVEDMHHLFLACPVL